MKKTFEIGANAIKFYDTKGEELFSIVEEAWVNNPSIVPDIARLIEARLSSAVYVLSDAFMDLAKKYIPVETIAEFSLPIDVEATKQLLVAMIPGIKPKVFETTKISIPCLIEHVRPNDVHPSMSLNCQTGWIRCAACGYATQNLLRLIHDIKIANPASKYTITFVTSFDKDKSAMAKLTFNSLEELMDVTDAQYTKEYLPEAEWDAWSDTIRMGVEVFCYINPYVEACYGKKALDFAESFESAETSYRRSLADS